jgi:AraC-like DNA-binding protein
MEQNFRFCVPLEKFGYLTGRTLTTFKKDFKNAFNTSPGRWLRHKRLELAHYQILEQRRKPSEVYLDTGFEDLSHFSFALKKTIWLSAKPVFRTEGRLSVRLPISCAGN